MDLAEKIRKEVEERLHYWEAQTKLQASQCNYTEAARAQQSVKSYRSILAFIDSSIAEEKWKQTHG